MSPGCSCETEIFRDMAYCEPEECGRDLPPWAHAHITSPEQSKPPDGDAPAHLYGTPRTDRAAATAAEAPPLLGGAGGGGACEGAGGGEGAGAGAAGAGA